MSIRIPPLRFDSQYRPIPPALSVVENRLQNVFRRPVSTYQILSRIECGNSRGHWLHTSIRLYPHLVPCRYRTFIATRQVVPQSCCNREPLSLVCSLLSYRLCWQLPATRAGVSRRRSRAKIPPSNLSIPHTQPQWSLCRSANTFGGLAGGRRGPPLRDSRAPVPPRARICVPLREDGSDETHDRGSRAVLRERHASPLPVVGRAASTHPAGIWVSADVNRVAHPVAGPFANSPYSRTHIPAGSAREVTHARQ